MDQRKSLPGSDEQSGAHSRPGGFCAGQPGSATEKRPAILANVGYAGSSRNPNTEPKARRQAMKEHSMFVGMDVHKNSIDIAIAEKGRRTTSESIPMREATSPARHRILPG